MGVARKLRGMVKKFVHALHVHNCRRISCGKAGNYEMLNITNMIIEGDNIESNVCHSLLFNKTALQCTTKEKGGITL